MNLIFITLKGAVQQVLFIIMPVTNKLSFYWAENDVQYRKDIGFETTDKLIKFLVNGRDEDCCMFTFDNDSADNARYFSCSQTRLKEIFDTYTTFFFVEKTAEQGPRGSIYGNLACYTEEQLRNMDAPGAMLN